MLLNSNTPLLAESDAWSMLHRLVQALLVPFQDPSRITVESLWWFIPGFVVGRWPRQCLGFVFKTTIVLSLIYIGLLSFEYYNHPPTVTDAIGAIERPTPWRQYMALVQSFAELGLQVLPCVPPAAYLGLLTGFSAATVRAVRRAKPLAAH